MKRMRGSSCQYVRDSCGFLIGRQIKGSPVIDRFSHPVAFIRFSLFYEKEISESKARGGAFSRDRNYCTKTRIYVM